MISSLRRRATALAVALLIALAITVFTGDDDAPMRVEAVNGTFSDVGLLAGPELIAGRKTTFGHEKRLLVEIRGNSMVRTGSHRNGVVESYDYRDERTSNIPDLPVILHCDRAVLKTASGAVLHAAPAASTCNGSQRMQTGTGRDLPAYLAFELPKPADLQSLVFELPVEVVAPEEDEWEVARVRLGLRDDAAFEVLRRTTVPPLLGKRQASIQFVVQPPPLKRGVFARLIGALP